MISGYVCMFDWKMPFTLVRSARQESQDVWVCWVWSIRQSSTLDSAILGLTRHWLPNWFPRVLMSPHFEPERAFHTQSQEIKQVRHSSQGAGLSAEILCISVLSVLSGLSFRIYQRLTAESCWVMLSLSFFSWFPAVWSSCRSNCCFFSRLSQHQST